MIRSKDNFLQVSDGAWIYFEDYGKDKGIPYDSLGPVVNDHVKLLILCGATAGVIRAATEQADNYAGLEILEVEDYPSAVSLATAGRRRGTW